MESEGLFRSLFEAAPDAIVIVDASGRIVLLNAPAESLFGYAREELVGRAVETLVPKRFQAAHEGHRGGYGASPHSRPMGSGLELYGVKRDGTEFPVEISLSPLQTEGGLLVSSAIRDISEKREAAERIRRLNLELKGRVGELAALNEELEAFSYSVSHDLRAPLRHIDGFARLLARHAGDRLDEKGRHYLETIEDSVRQMGRLIDDLLAFSRLGRAPLRSEAVDLAALARDAIREIEEDWKGREIRWTVGELPAVRGDAALLRQVFVNLLSNAVKYSSRRGVSEIEIATAGSTPDEVVCIVRDNGVGFDGKYAGKLFGVFQRLHGAEDFEGTGIGLASVRRIIQKHGGRTWAEGAVDSGATFSFSLPRPRKENEWRK
ncbi:MAG TPA: PAS domain S-box protein [Thermoanaerobaculia bacterium]|nr:PAS domain S-box protein [Thermoanaerobaculia bacterium]